MNEPSEKKTGIEATTETKNEQAGQPAAGTDVSDVELASVAGGIQGSVGAGKNNPFTPGGSPPASA